MNEFDILIENLIQTFFSDLSPGNISLIKGGLVFVGFWLLAYFGALTLYIFVFSNTNDNVGARRFLDRIFPNKSPEFRSRADFIISTILGSLIGIIIYSPQTPIEAYLSGLGWVGALNTIVNRNQFNDKASETDK